MRKLIGAATAAAMLLGSASSVMAQTSVFDSQFISPQQTTASLNMKVPLGGSRTPAKPTVGFSVERGQTMQGMPGANAEKSTMTDFRFGDSGLQTAKVGGYDFAGTRTDLPEGTRENLRGGFIIPVVAVIAIILGILALSNNDSHYRSCHPNCTD